MMPWVLRVILMLKGAMCVVFQRNVIWRHLYDASMRTSSNMILLYVYPGEDSSMHIFI